MLFIYHYYSVIKFIVSTTSLTVENISTLDY